MAKCNIYRWAIQNEPTLHAHIKQHVHIASVLSHFLMYIAV